MRFFYFTILFVIVFSCSDSKTKRSKLIHFVPENSSIIIRTSNLENLKSSINNSDFIKKTSKTDFYKHLESEFKNITQLKPKSEILICLSKNKNDSIEYAFITNYHKQLFVSDSLTNYSEESLSYKNNIITKSTLNEIVFFSTITDSTFFASSSKNIVEDIYNKQHKNAELEKIYNTTNSNRTLSIILKANNPFVESLFIEDSPALSTFTNYIAIDADVNQNEIFINGITKASDSTKKLINIFKNTIPQENKTQSITPANSDGFMSFTFDDFKTFETNLNTYKNDSISKSSTLYDNIIEVGVIYEDDNKAIILNSIDVIATKDALLSNQNTIETYRQIEIYNFNKPNIFSNAFSPLITFNGANKYCVIDNFFVFANSMDVLQNIIANYQNKTTYSERSYFKNIKEQLSDESSLLIVVNPKILNEVINKNTSTKTSFKLSNYKTSAIQFIYDTNFAHINATLKKDKARATQNSISEILNIKLERDLLNSPQFVTNHITKQKEIVVQDINNNLYLISNRGKILWKKQLHGPVLGKIEQIDIYKNGRLQLAFTTPKRVYVLDRNGKDVGPFPGKFNDEITQPLSVFDYDKNKNYRLLVTQGKNTLMYNTKAKVVNGFTFKAANNTIISQPKHFRIGSKDYIVLKSKNRLYILNRTGENRVTPKTSSTYSSEDIYLYKNKFTTTTASGNLISIDTKGNTAITNLNLNKKHHIETTSKTLVTLNENKLGIKGKTVELDFGNYSNPKLFYINDKIYVSVTDLQSQKVYLYDSQGKLLPNFPVYGNTEITLDNIDKDKNLEFVTKGDTNAVILYQIN